MTIINIFKDISYSIFAIFVNLKSYLLSIEGNLLLKRFKSVGYGCKIYMPAHIEGSEFIELGDKVLIGKYTYGNTGELK